MPDHIRPLNPRGEEAASRIGAYMARHALVPDYVLCSTSRRTRDTWALVAKELTKIPSPSYDRRLYNAEPDAILAVLRETAPEIHALLVIGHNPGLHDLAILLIASGDVDQRERLREKLPTSGIVVIDFAVDAWSAIHRQGGRLDRFVIPREERHLETRFGETYRDYKRRVRRWL